MKSLSRSATEPDPAVETVAVMDLRGVIARDYVTGIRHLSGLKNVSNIVVLVSNMTPFDMTLLVGSGARCILGKVARVEEVCEALHASFRCCVMVPVESLNSLCSIYFQPGGRDLRQILGSMDDVGRRIVSLLIRGLSNREIANECFVSESVVKQVISKLIREAGVSNRTALSYTLGVNGLGGEDL